MCQAWGVWMALEGLIGPCFVDFLVFLVSWANACLGRGQVFGLFSPPALAPVTMWGGAAGLEPSFWPFLPILTDCRFLDYYAFWRLNEVLGFVNARWVSS